MISERSEITVLNASSECSEEKKNRLNASRIHSNIEFLSKKILNLVITLSHLIFLLLKKSPGGVVVASSRASFDFLTTKEILKTNYAQSVI